jgi:hypothetical protein
LTLPASLLKPLGLEVAVPAAVLVATEVLPNCEL